MSFALLVSNLHPFSPVSSCNCSHSSRSRCSSHFGSQANKVQRPRQILLKVSTLGLANEKYIQIAVVFGARPPLNVLVPGISKASMQNSQHLKKTKWPPRKFEHFTASGRSENNFPTFSMIWATFCTHLNHCYLYVLFISQPQSTNFEQNLTRSLHFIGLTSKVGGAS